MPVEMSAAIPLILYGAFDRHNFGDLLFAHVAAALLSERNLVFAGVAARDLRRDGGHRVQALADLAARWRDCPVNLIHAGGELLTCDTWEAAVMTLPPQEALDVILRFDGHPREAMEWAQHRLGIAALAPYTVQRALFPQAKAVIYNAVGGVDLATRDPAFRAEVLANLKAADVVGVRDKVTQAQLQASGIPARLMPDPAVLVAELFGEGIRRRTGKPAEVRRAFPQGYLAVQFSTEFGDDATLQRIAEQLDALASETGFGIAFFRAGAAPWHDDMDCFARTVARMKNRTVRLFTSLDIWDICALIAGSRGYLGSSLHGRIVAMAFGLPRLNLMLAGAHAKQLAFAATWENPEMVGCVQVQGIAQGMRAALESDAESRRRKARELATHYRRAFETLCAGRLVSRKA